MNVHLWAKFKDRAEENKHSIATLPSRWNVTVPNSTCFLQSPKTACLTWSFRREEFHRTVLSDMLQNSEEKYRAAAQSMNPWAATKEALH